MRRLNHSLNAIEWVFNKIKGKKYLGAWIIPAGFRSDGFSMMIPGDERVFFNKNFNGY
jgi:hypothetical protein